MSEGEGVSRGPHGCYLFHWLSKASANCLNARRPVGSVELRRQRERHRPAVPRLGTFDARLVVTGLPVDARNRSAGGGDGSSGSWCAAASDYKAGRTATEMVQYMRAGIGPASRACTGAPLRAWVPDSARSPIWRLL